MVKTVKPDLSKEEVIREYLVKSDKVLFRGLLAIYRRQTEDEKQVKTTIYRNKVGFSGCDAEILTSLAKWLESKGFLTEKQKKIARKKMLKYAGQLSKIATGKI